MHELTAVYVEPPAEYVPAGHAVPAVEPSGQKDPAGHGDETGGEPGQMEPAGHGFAISVVLPVPPQ